MSENSKNKVITRIAPSPTGYLHIGTARSALFNFLYAKKFGGEFVVRIEDTDTARSLKKYEEDILGGLRWLGLSYDRLERQSERTEIYKNYINKLIENGKAYISKEDSKVNPEEKIEIIRLKNEGKDITFEDEVRGEVAFNTEELGDFVIARSVTEPLYHLAVVIDDYEMGITHVIRGEDHISNTPRQILIQEAIGVERPIYAHLPLILAEDKSKMSKRKGVVSISEYKKMGFLSEAMLNFLALLGWNPGDDREMFSIDELIENFELEKVQKGGAVFNTEKLKWFNGEYLKKMSDEDFKKGLIQFTPEELKSLDSYDEKVINKLVPMMRERISVFKDVEDMYREGEFGFYFENPEYEVENLKWKGEGELGDIKKYLEKISEILNSIEENDFNAVSIKEAIWDYASEEGRGSVLWPFRYSLTGKDKSPDPFLVSEILGKKETIFRVSFAIKNIE